MGKREKHVVTGGFGFTGRYIAAELLARGHDVSTLTNSPERKNSLEQTIPAHPFHFDDQEKLTEILRGTEVLYNTYWVRFNHKLFTHQDAVDNTLILFKAAAKAGVKRIVHVSITNPSIGSQLEYFQGKAVLEKALGDSGISHAILRPAVIFGKEDILINNIAWLLRKMPIFPIFGYGSYKIRPIFVQDFAKLAVLEGQRQQNVVIDAVGPETYSYKELVEKIGDIIGVKKPLVSLSPGLAHWVGAIVGSIVRDVVVTKEEIKGLMADLLCTEGDSTGVTKLSGWARDHAQELGHCYMSELGRRTDRKASYG
ncbi:MAG: NAD(P)H-binding protein [Desulfobulbaceae bacterium]|nr:NAD(P)H-binding protein [Desulfobulbaceae bacterium]